MRTELARTYKLTLSLLPTMASPRDYLPLLSRVEVSIAWTKVHDEFQEFLYSFLLFAKFEKFYTNAFIGPTGVLSECRRCEWSGAGARGTRNGYQCAECWVAIPVSWGSGDNKWYHGYDCWIPEERLAHEPRQPSSIECGEELGHITGRIDGEG